MHLFKASLLLTTLFVAFSANARAQKAVAIDGTPEIQAQSPRDADPVGVDAAAAAATNVPTWTSHFTSGGNSYSYTMVGANPTTSNATTKIPTVIIPLIFKSGSLTITPLAAGCGDTTAALTRVQKSPLFNNVAYKIGTTNLGTGQYIDIFQRANFWQSVGSVTPNYHTTLSPVTVAPAQTITVPKGRGAVFGYACTGHPIGEVITSVVANALPGLLTKLKIPKTSFPLFVSYDVVEVSKLGANGVIFGWHSETSSNQTYGIGTYLDPGVFTGAADVSALSHEVGEWVNDPFGNNLVPQWGHIGQVAGCQNNLEVGDPLSGTTPISVKLNGFTYHLQDLAFFSWFARESPSIAINGLYDPRGVFTAPSKSCP
jgi:hypothetical protein